MIAYKGTDKDMKCRGFQYELGKVYETAAAECCKNGFHACEYPLDVLKYYPPDSSRYFVVEQGGEISKDDDDSKQASTQIELKAEIGGLLSLSRRRCGTPRSAPQRDLADVLRATRALPVLRATGELPVLRATRALPVLRGEMVWLWLRAINARLWGPRAA